MKKTITLLMVLVTIAVFSAFKQDNAITIFMIGDSTMANKNINHGNKERGWGMALQCYFNDSIRVDNHAVNGRSSKSFINEGRWDSVLSAIEPGDYVVIQFGHNDEKPKADRHTDPGSTFDYNLRKFIRETRERGGIPILMNCVVRRNFFKQVPKNDDDEKLRLTTNDNASQKANAQKEEGDTLVDTHGLYIQAPRDVAKEMRCYFVDANKLTHDLEQGMGKDDSKKLHMWFLPGQEPSIPKGRQDNTHYNIYGAHVVAKMLADAICKEVPVLKSYRVDYDYAIDKYGRGDFMTVGEAISAVEKGKPTTIQIMSGEWTKPKLPKGKKITWVLRGNAKWQK